MKLVNVRYPVLGQLFTLLLVLGSSTAALATPYVPPSGLGAPGRRESAGTRGCAFGNPASLIALMPTENIGLTAEQYPQFYWYMPVSQAQFLEFTLSPMGADGEAIAPIYTTRLAVPEAAGIMSLELPETANLPLLEAGDRYQWQVAAFCNPQSEDGDLQIQGWFEYQPPTAGLQSSLDLVSEADQASLYAQNGYWFDAVDHLATLNASAPEDDLLQTRWAELLLSVELDDVVDQPLLIRDAED